MLSLEFMDTPDVFSNCPFSWTHVQAAVTSRAWERGREALGQGSHSTCSQEPTISGETDTSERSSTMPRIHPGTNVWCFPGPSNRGLFSLIFSSARSLRVSCWLLSRRAGFRCSLSQASAQPDPQSPWHCCPRLWKMLASASENPTPPSPNSTLASLQALDSEFIF